jgi:hypothetical protein
VLTGVYERYSMFVPFAFGKHVLVAAETGSADSPMRACAMSENLAWFFLNCLPPLDRLPTWQRGASC